MINSIGKAMSAASHGMTAQAFRLRVVSENLSNADTHGYQRKLLTFSNAFDRVSGIEGVKVDDVTLDQTQGEVRFEPTHPLADDQGYVTLSNVNVMIEIADAQEASRSYEANLTTFRQATQMYSSLLDLLRR